MSSPLNIAMIGSGFMGRAHSQAWASANRFFELPRRARMRTVVGRDLAGARLFSERWGWADFTSDLKCALEDDAIELIDIVTPNHLHAPQAIAALQAGKHVACEKPLAGTLEEARAMRDAAKAARSRKRLGDQRSFVWFNYRRCPAVALAHQLVKKKKLGRIYHIRAQYLQDWGQSETPLSWRFQGNLAGSGAHGDLNAHIIDLARFITGDEIIEVSGAIEKTFIEQRPSARPRAREAASGSGGRRVPAKKIGRSTVDDCVLFLARFKMGAVASFEATRLATGNLNRNQIEINGEHGAIKFDFERMNELQWWDNALDGQLRGWSTISCTLPGVHPYMDAYWPPGHAIGYEHTFISQAADIIRALAGRKPVVPLPDFEDAYQTQRVLEAAIVSARQGRAVRMSEIK